MDSATVARGLALVLSLILSLILATLPASALNFRVTHPPRGSTWPTGSLLDVRWSLDNVTLPLPDLRVHIDLYDAQGSYVQQIATNLANEGLFQWTVPLALDLSRGGGYALVVGGVDVRGEEQGVGSSGAVHVVDVQAARGSVALLVVEPKRDRRFFAGEPVHVVWTRSSAYPQLPWGVHVELRERNGPAVLRIAENVTFNGAETSSVEWVVPDALPLAPGDVEFQGTLFLYGYDISRQRLVYGTTDLIVDYTDRTPLTLRFISPTTATRWTMGTRVEIQLALGQLSCVDCLESRVVTVRTMEMYDVRNRKVLVVVGAPMTWRVDKTASIAFDVGDGLVPADVHLPKDALPGGNAGNASTNTHDSHPTNAQHAFIAATVYDDIPQYRLSYAGSYQGIGGQIFPIDGYSTLFSIVPYGRGNGEDDQKKHPGAGIRLRAAPWLLAATMCAAMFTLIP